MNLAYKVSAFLILIFAIGCSAQKEIKTDLEIYYKAFTRGSIEEVTLSKKTLFHKKNNALKEVVLNDKKYNQLLKLLSNIKVEEISNLTAPTNKRFTDGALIANITITQKNKEYTSLDFDHGNPPEELKLLINYIFSQLD